MRRPNNQLSCEERHLFQGEGGTLNVAAADKTVFKTSIPSFTSPLVSLLFKLIGITATGTFEAKKKSISYVSKALQ